MYFHADFFITIWINADHAYFRSAVHPGCTNYLWLALNHPSAECKAENTYHKRYGPEHNSDYTQRFCVLQEIFNQYDSPLMVGEFDYFRYNIAHVAGKRNHDGCDRGLD